MPVAALALMGAVPAATAFAQQGQELFEWSGRVDREVQIVMRGNSVSTNRVGPTESGRMNARAMSMMPRANGQVVVQKLNGRGNVDVIQQPSVANGFTTIVRVQDPRAGQDDYRLAAYWQGGSGSTVYGGRNGAIYGGNGGNDTRGDVVRPDDHDRDHDYDREREHERERERRERERERERERNNGNNGNYGNSAGNGRYGANQALHWSGNVDGELEIRVQNGRIAYRNISGHQPTNIRADAGSMNMPRGAANVSVVQNQGRGVVSVIQQPSSFNGYTTVLRVRDPQGGYGFYDFSLLWR
jgi:hypothetical protein